MSEKHVHQAVVNYLKLQYPSVPFRSDTGAGMKLTIGQAMGQKAIQNGMAWPDLFIAEPRNAYCGMFIELKDEGVKIFNKSGKYASQHIADQAECLNMLRRKGYIASFCIGFDEAKQLIDEYLKLEPCQESHL